MRDAIRLGLILMVICVVTGGALGYVNQITEPKIAQSKGEALQTALAKAYPEGEVFRVAPASGREANPGATSSARANVEKVYQAFTDGALSGFVVDVSSEGYGGPIRLLLGVGMEGAIRGLEVVDQTETPGLGTQVKAPQYRERYTGLDSPESVQVTKDGGTVQAITGATISSRAISAGVAAALKAVAAMPTGQ